MNSPAPKGLNKSHNFILRIAILLALATIAPAAFGQDAWDHTDLPRFQLLASFANQAVLDRETGIVWQRSPSTVTFTWFAAQDRCNRLPIATRMGWRLPTIQELTSLLSVGAPPNNLEPGHPFTNVPAFGEIIWSSTSSAANANNGWSLTLPQTVNTLPKTIQGRCWCVRFRQGPDAQ